MIDKLLPPQFKRIDDPADQALYKGLVPKQKDLWPSKFPWIHLAYARLLASHLQSLGHDVKWVPFKLHDLDGILLSYEDANGDKFYYAGQQADLFSVENKVYSERRRVQKTPRKNKRTKQVSDYARVILEGKFLKLTGLNLGEDYDATVFQRPDGKPYILIVPGATMSINIKEALAQEDDNPDDWVELTSKEKGEK